MYSRIISFLEKFHLLNDSQFGFRSKRSCVDAIAHIVEKIREDHHKTFYTCIFLDLKKAFDTVDHTRLLQKIYNLGIRGKAFYCLQSYLQGRTQVVSINNCSSQERDINYGVPQGSILGPMLFIIYINDILSVCDKIQPTLFADDTNLLISMEKAAIAEFANDMELNRNDMWLKVNKLSPNLDKTHCMPFKKKNRYDFTTGSETIKVTSAVKYLGVWIDGNLKFCEHVGYLLKKLGKHLGVVARLRHFVSKNVLFNYYNVYVKPVLQYGLLTHGGNSFSNSDKLSVYNVK